MNYLIQRGDVVEDPPTFLSTKSLKELWVCPPYLFLTPMRFQNEYTAEQIMLMHFGKDCPHTVVPEENHAD